MSLAELERVSRQQNMELQREERRFFGRLQNLQCLRNRCNELYQQRDKIEKLSSLHDKLLQQEFTLRKLRRIRSEVDSQRLKNEKLARELGQVKQECEDKDSKLSATKAVMQKAISLANTEKLLQQKPAEIPTVEVKKPTITVELSNGYEKNQDGVAKTTVISKPVGVSIKFAHQNGFAGNNNGNIANGNHSLTDDDEIATSFITGWTPKSTTLVAEQDIPTRPNFARHSASDAELSSSGFGSENGGHGPLIVSISDGGPVYGLGENARPSSEVIISHTNLPTYRYMPKQSTFLKRIGVDGGRKKTVESLYKDFHPRALQTPVSILDETEQNNNNATWATPAVAVVKAQSEVSTQESKQQQSILVSGSSNKTAAKSTSDKRVRFDPLALLLDAALDGDLELVGSMLKEVQDPSAPNDEGITALHNAICAGHAEMVQLLVSFGVDVNSADCDGWTGLHCAASCNNKALCQLLVENGAACLALTTPDRETPRDKCEPDEECFAECYAYLLEVEEQLGRSNEGVVYGAFDFKPNKENEFDPDMLEFTMGDALKIIRRGDDDGGETNWWWATLQNGDEGKEGYVPNSYLTLHPRNESFCQRYGKNVNGACKT